MKKNLTSLKCDRVTGNLFIGKYRDVTVNVMRCGSIGWCAKFKHVFGHTAVTDYHNSKRGAVNAVKRMIDSMCDL